MTTPTVPHTVVVDHTGQLGGGELALYRLLDELAPRAELDVVLLSDGPLAARLREAGIRTRVLPLDPRVGTVSRDRVLSPGSLIRSLAHTVGFVPRLARSLRATGADLIVANTLKAAVLVALAAPLARRGWVWHLHDRLATDYLSAPVMHAMRLLAVFGPRWIVANSSATLSTLPPRARVKANVAYPGLPITAFEVARPRPDGRPAVGIIGRISPTKGQREFLLAASEVAVTRSDVRFVVIGAALFGEERYESEIRALPKALGIAERVDFAGWVDDPVTRLRELTLLVHASPVPEPFGQVVVEAMAAGVPVVATAAGGVPEILDPSGASSMTEGWAATPLGVLVRPGDVHALAAALAAVLDDPAAGDARAASARTAAEGRFSIGTTAQIVEAAWCRAIADSRAATVD